MLVNVASLKYGVIFKKVFRHPDVFCAFVKDALGIEIKVKEVREEYEYPEPVGHVKVRYDLFAEDLEKRVIVEIQHVRESDFYDRFMHYHITAIADQAKSHEDYRTEKSVYTLVVLTSMPRDKSVDYSVAVVEFDAQVQDADRLGQKLGVYRHRMLLLNPKLVSEQTPPALRRWLELIKDTLDKKVDDEQYPGEMFRKIIGDITNENLSPEELTVLKDEVAWEKTQQDARAEGRAEGEEIGIKKGEEIGIRKGKLEGIEALLEVKFGANGLSLMEDIGKISDVEKLSQVQQRIKKVKTLEELRSKL